MLDFGRLRALVAVAEHGSMTSAAAALCCTQPAVSRQIAALERQAGARLVVRTPNGARLTPVGELLVSHARNMIDRLSRAERQLAMLTDAGGTGLRIGSFSSANTVLLPQAIREYLRRHPRAAKPLVPTTDPEEHLTALRDGELDLALVTEWDLHGQDLDGVELIPLTEDELLLALPETHPLANRRVRLSDLLDDTWIDGAHPDCLGPLDGLLGSFGRIPSVGIRCDDWTGKQGLVASGAGVMLFPALARLSARPDITLMHLDDEIPRRRIYLACPDGGRRVPAVASMVELLRAAGRHYGP
ncbi:LysR family transcriptional regulator [Wenjunlia tyrosinilytica]|uniref:LysR family transcriptional regulator n=1 Tax=Wenjunlia tyrosinilytica TaxID=1544741 RepID=A0A918DUE5_9ACTN|nr:LysR family transcriptional regulator [Wenjunlia tyrosinilytica]GGO82394.1 LysR family transcriptional regulator [Wenjunlia tyrosinilytica]